MDAGPVLAEVGLGRVSGLEYDLLQRAALIGSIYGVVILAGLAVGIAAMVRWSRRPPDWRAAVGRLCARPVGRVEVAAVLSVIAFAFLLLLPFGRAIPVLAERAGISFESALLVVQSVAFHWFGIAAIAIVLARRRVSWRDAFGIAPLAAARHALAGLLWLLGSMPVLILYTIVYHAILQALGHEPSLQDVVFAIADETSPWMRAYFVLLAAVLAPVFEELLFRGVLLAALARRFGALTASIAVSLVFAGIHGHVPSFMPLFLLSMAMCGGYILTGSLTAAIAMHCLFNGMTVSILLTLR